jgi:DNA-binding NarL/FixJ family response regulator
MPRVRWTPEEDERLVDLIAAGKSWTSISGTLKRSMKSVELHANTLRLVGAKKERGLKEMRTARAQAMEKTGAALQANARKLPSGPAATNYFRISGNFLGK